MSQPRSLRSGALAAVLALACALAAPAALAITLTFDDLESGQQPTSVQENSFLFSVSSSFLSVGDGTISPFVVGTGMTVERVSGRPFDLLSFRVREVNGSVGPQAFSVTGVTAEEEIVFEAFLTDGDCPDPVSCFGTVVLPESFRDLVVVEFIDGIVRYDDLVVDFPAIRFDGIASGVTSYVENGLVVESDLAIFIDAFSAPDPPSIFPSNFGSRFTLRSVDGGVFDFATLEARELNEGIGVTPVVLRGEQLDGTPVEVSFQTDGVCCFGVPRFGFQQFVLPPEFRQLVSVEWLASEALVALDDLEAKLAVPDNDLAAQATALPPEGGAFRGTLVRADNDGNVSLGDSGTSPDVWFTLSPAENTRYAIDTCGTHDAGGVDSGADTVLTVHDELPASDANQIADNDDAPDGPLPAACDGFDGGEDQRDAALVVDVPQGTTAFVRVARAGGTSARGDFTLTVAVPEPGAMGSGLAAIATLFAALRWKRGRGRLDQKWKPTPTTGPLSSTSSWRFVDGRSRSAFTCL